MAQTNPKLAQIDPVWQRICNEAEDVRFAPQIAGACAGVPYFDEARIF